VSGCLTTRPPPLFLVTVDSASILLFASIMCVYIPRLDVRLVCPRFSSNKAPCVFVCVCDCVPFLLPVHPLRVTRSDPNPPLSLHMPVSSDSPPRPIGRCLYRRVIWRVARYHIPIVLCVCVCVFLCVCVCVASVYASCICL
jgi:hypothetical protein